MSHIPIIKFRGLLAIVAAAVAALLPAACSKPPTSFANDVLLPFTPVKNQGATASCWAYAMLSTIETEHILRGDSIHLSAAFVERVMERDSLAPRSKRAMGQTLINLIMRYGLVPYDAMPHADLPLPRKAFVEGVEYSLTEFAHSVCQPDEYVALCTSRSQPYGQQVVLNVPDNWEHNQFLNLPPDSLLRVARTALAHRHPVCWEGDTSEPGFNFRQGYAITTFWHGSTTDDHCMAMVGLAHDQEGRLYFVMKNSWGRHNAYGGLMYVSEDYFLNKTIAIYLTREALDCTRIPLNVQ